MPGSRPERAADLVALLLEHGIEVGRARAPFQSRVAHGYLSDTATPRSFPAGAITLGGLLAENEAFTTASFSYPSDGLTITGLAHVPAGDGPFPVLIMLHGYYNRDAYFSGAGTWQSADYFARRGYLVLAPDLRSWGGSEAGLSLFHMGLVADVLHLLAALPSLPMADPDRVGLWGHSMGGGLATKVLVVDEQVRAAVHYAPNSADDADLIARWGRGCLPGESEAAGDFCNPAEIIPAGTPPELIEAYLAAAADADFLQQVAPLYHLERVGAPVQIHVGLDDGTGLAETPPNWSARLAEGLEAAGRDVTYFTYPDQGHFFSGESWMTLHERSLVLFDDHVKKAP